MKLRLEVVEGPSKGQIAVLTGEVSVVGRSESCSLDLPDPTISGEHAAIRRDPEGNGFLVEDLGSTAGTWLNGRMVRIAMLADGDTLRLGNTQLRVRTYAGGEVPPEEVEIVRTGAKQTLRMNPHVVNVRLGALREGLESGVGELPTSRVQQPATDRLAPPSDLQLDPATARLDQLCELSIALAATHNPDGLAREAAARLCALFPQVRRVGLFELDEDEGGGEQVLRPRYLLDRGPRSQGQRVTISLSVLQTAIKERQALLSQDVGADPRFQLSQSLSEAGVVSIVCVPLTVGERTVGALYVDTADASRPFQASDLRLITGVAAILAAALENARLFARVQVEFARRASLERYFAPDLVDRVLKGEVPLARQGRSAAGTILFIDIRGFTRLTDTTEPRRLVEMLNAYFSAMQRIIFRSGGTVERFGGDSILAYWGVVEEDQEHQGHGAGAALAMLAEAWRLNPELEASGGPTLRVAVGINSGQVVVGDVGGPERYEFTILGTAINLARRLESLSGPWEVIAGAETVQALGPRALTVPLPPTTVKGIDSAVAVSALYGLRTSGDGALMERWDLALESTLDLGRGPSIALVTGLLRNAQMVWLEVLTRADPEGNTPARVVIRPPRSSLDMTALGRTVPPTPGPGGGADLTETRLPFLAKEVAEERRAGAGGAMRRLRIQVANAPLLLSFLGIAR